MAASNRQSRGRMIDWLELPYDVAIPALEEGESVLMETAGSLLGWLPTQGKIILSNRRIFYRPLRLKFDPIRWRKLDLRLTDIESIRDRLWTRGLWGGFPGFPSITITLKTGESYTLQFWFAGYWRKKLTQLMRDQKA